MPTITRETARNLMPVVDKAITPALAAIGFEAFRFDAAVHDAEGFMVLKIKIRPIGRA
mgnify:CR=1 FL=1